MAHAEPGRAPSCCCAASPSSFWLEPSWPSSSWPALFGRRLLLGRRLLGRCPLGWKPSWPSSSWPELWWQRSQAERSARVSAGSTARAPRARHPEAAEQPAGVLGQRSERGEPSGHLADRAHEVAELIRQQSETGGAERLDHPLEVGRGRPHRRFEHLRHLVGGRTSFTDRVIWASSP